jgi:hypothetical protein
MFLNKFVSLLLVISVITLSVIKAVTWVVIPKYPIGIVSPDPVKLTTEKTLTVTVTKNPDDDEALQSCYHVSE